MYKIVIDGEDYSVVPAYNTPEEVQHEMAQRLGKKVRVIEFIKQDPPDKRERWEEDRFSG